MEMWKSSQCFGLYDTLGKWVCEFVLWMQSIFCEIHFRSGFDCTSISLKVFSSRPLILWILFQIELTRTDIFGVDSRTTGDTVAPRHFVTAWRARFRRRLLARHLLSIWRGAVLIAGDTAIIDRGMRATVMTSRAMEKNSTACMNGLNCFLQMPAISKYSTENRTALNWSRSLARHWRLMRSENQDLFAVMRSP